MKRILCFAAVAVLLSALAVAADDDPKILMQLDREFAETFAAKGIDGWIQYMAPNAVELSAEPLVGTEQMRTGLGKVFSAPGFHLTWVPTKAELVGKGGVGYTVGRYQQTSIGADGKPRVERGSYLTTWQKQRDGSWKVVSDIGSPDPQ
jgi:ketosteroid isomerase-like protein